ncbi:MAG: ATP-binding protein [Dehalococcoidia bacterium]
MNRAFVGRRQKLTELTNALDDAMPGTGRLVMLVGEPSIGKSRAAQELSSISEKRGAQTL